MNAKNSGQNLSPNEKIGMSIVQNSDGSESYEAHTPNSYDGHIVPAETAARQEREGVDFKHVPKHSTGSEHLDSSRGRVVDKEGLTDNFAVEPEMYYEIRGDIPSHASEVRQEKLHQEELHQEAVHQEDLRQEKVHRDTVQREKLY